MPSSALATLFTWTSALVLWVLTASTSWAGTVQAPLEVTEAEPGEAVTLAFTLLGDGVAARIEPDVQLPPRWRLLLPEVPFGLGATDALVRLVTVVIPNRAEVGEYDIRYSIGTDEATATVVVRGQPDVQVAIRGLPEAVLRDEPVDVEIATYNSGNTTIAPTLDFRGSRGFADIEPIALDPIAPGDVQVTSVELSPRGGSGKTSLRVVAREEQEVIGQASTSTLTAIDPNASRRDRVILPATVDLSGWFTEINGDFKAGPQVRAATRGFIDPYEQHRVDVNLQGPDIVGLTAGGFQRSEYRGRYTFSDGERGVDIRLGDERFQNSQLILRTLRQRGAAVDVDLGRVTVGGLAVQDRFVANPRTLVGPTAQVQVTDALVVGGSAVRQSIGEDVSLIANQFTQLRFRKQTTDVTASYEVAYGEGLAGFVQTSLRAGPVRLNANARHAESSFTGEFGGQTVVGGTGAWRLGKTLTLAGNGIYRRDIGNARIALPRDRVSSLGGGTLVWTPSRQLYTRAGYQYRDIDDRLQPSLGRQQNTVTGAVGTRGDLGRLELTSLTRLTSQVAGGEGVSQELRVTASSDARKALTLYTTTGFVLGITEQSLPRERFYSTTGIRVQGGDSWRSNLSYGINFYPSSTIPTQHQALAGLSYSLPWKHRFHADGQFNSGLNNFRATAIAGYEIPFNIPAMRTGVDGRVMGHVLRDDDTPVVGAQMRFGNYISETDANGRFLFNGLDYSVQALDIVRSTLSPGEVVDGVLPQDVTPSRRSEPLEDRVIRVVSAGQVEAEVWRYTLANPLQVRLAGAPPEYSRESAVVGAPLTLTSGDKTRFGITDERGMVVVDQLPPGRWNAVLALPQRETDMRIEQPRFMVMVDGGQMSSYTLRVVPDTQPLNLLIDSTVTLRVGEESGLETPETSPEPTEPTAIVRLEIRPETLILDPEDEVQLRALAVYSDDTAQTLQEGVDWTSSNPSVARVDDDGLLTAQADGNSQVTAQVGPTTSPPVSVEVVDVPVVGLSLNTAEVLLGVGQKQTLGVQAVYVDGRIRAVSEGLQWTTSDTQVARVSQTGELTGVASGTAQVWAEFAGVRTFPATIVVGSVSAVTLNITDTQLRPGDAFRPVVTALLADGTEQDVTALVEWRTSTSDVLRQFGVEFVAQTPGAVAITASFNGRPSNEVQMTVQSPLGLLVEPEITTVPVGKSIRFVARAIYPDGTTTTPERPEWSTTDPTRATISTEGRVSAVAAGDVELVVQADGTSTRRSLRIVGGQRTLRPNVAEQRLEAGDNQLRVVGAYADGTEVDLTPWVQTWTSSDPSIVEVSNTGIATGQSNGQATVTARLDGETVIFELDIRL